MATQRTCRCSDTCDRTWLSRRTRTLRKARAMKAGRMSSSDRPSPFSSGTCFRSRPASRRSATSRTGEVYTAPPAARSFVECEASRHLLAASRRRSPPRTPASACSVLPERGRQRSLCSGVLPSPHGRRAPRSSVVCRSAPPRPAPFRGARLRRPACGWMRFTFCACSGCGAVSMR